MRPSSLILALLFAVGLAGGCSEQARERQDEPAGSPAVPTVETVRQGYTPIASSIPAVVAADKGLDERNHVDLQSVTFTSSNDMLAALIAGQVDVLPAVSLVPILHLESEHPGTVRLFSHSRMSSDHAFDSIIVRTDSEIRSLAELQGHKIGVFPGTSATNLLRTFLVEKGVATDSITFVQLPPATHIQSLESGAVEAVFSYEPVTTSAVMDAGFRQLHGSVYAALQDPCPVGASVISRNFEKTHPRAAAGTIKAIDEAVLWTRQNPTEARSLLPGLTKVPIATAERVNLVDVTLSSEVDTSSLQRFADLLVRSGELERAIDVEGLVRP